MQALRVVFFGILLCSVFSRAAPLPEHYKTCTQNSLPTLNTKIFQHARNQTIAHMRADHHTSDAIVWQGKEILLEADFTYGPIQTPLRGELVELWVDFCRESLQKIEVVTTTEEGRVRISLRGEYTRHAGEFQFFWRVAGDNSFVQGTLKVLPAESHLIVAYVESNLTQDEKSRELRQGAREFLQLRADQGCPIVYIATAHKIGWTSLREWLKEKHMPKGTMVVEDEKVNYLSYLCGQAMIIDTVYAGSHVQISKALQGGVVPERIMVIGESGGSNGTMRLGSDFKGHGRELEAASKIEQPFHQLY